MVRKSYTPEQIINKLRVAEVLLSQGATLAVIWKKIGVSDCTYYRWRKECGQLSALFSSPRNGVENGSKQA